MIVIQLCFSLLSRMKAACSSCCRGVWRGVQADERRLGRAQFCSMVRVFVSFACGHSSFERSFPRGLYDLKFLFTEKGASLQTHCVGLIFQQPVECIKVNIRSV